MASIAEKIGERITKVSYDDISDDTRHEIKRGILDTIGCCLGGLAMDKGRYAAMAANKMGGTAESTIIGTGDKVSCVHAVLANGETANAQDWSAGCAFHDVPIVASTVLAVAEAVGASGKDILLSAAIGLETSGRVGRAGASAYAPITEGPDRGKIHWDPVTGMTHGTFGAVAATGKLLNLDPDRMANAIGIAGYICPPQTFRKFNFTTPIKNTKYAPLGWVAHAGVSAALMAETGYTGDTDLFEGEYGFGRYTGVLRFHPGNILRRLEGPIPTLRLFFKVYPMGRILPGAIDNLLLIVKEQNLAPDDIDNVVAKIHILGSFPVFTQNRLETQDDYCFNAKYALSCIAHGIPPVQWHDDEIRCHAGVLSFMDKVEIVFNEKEDGLAMIEDSAARPMWVEVTARGKTYRKESSHIMGSYHPEEHRMTDDMLKEKFKSNASRVLPKKNIREIENIIFDLENLAHVSDLMKWVAK